MARMACLSLLACMLLPGVYAQNACAASGGDACATQAGDSLVQMHATKVKLATKLKEEKAMRIKTKQSRHGSRPNVRQRLKGPSSPPSLAVLREALNSTADAVVMLSATGENAASPQSVTAVGPDGSQMTFTTVFETKLCKDLTRSDLPHLSANAVTEIATMLSSDPGLKPVCTVAFGVLVVVDGLSSAGTYNGYKQGPIAQLLANSLATVLDQDWNGQADDPKLAEKMRTGPAGFWLHVRRKGNTKQEQWVQKLGYTVEVSEEHDFQPGMKILHTRRACFEEMYHTVQTARSKVHPDKWNLDDTPESCLDNPTTCDWTQSVASRCGSKAQCNWYSHPENTCSIRGSTASSASITGGGCAGTSCAGIEWAYNVEMVWSSNHRFSHGHEDYWWKNRASITSRLKQSGGACNELLVELKKGPALKNKLNFNYSPDGQPEGPSPSPPSPSPPSPLPPSSSPPSTSPQPEGPDDGEDEEDKDDEEDDEDKDDEEDDEDDGEWYWEEEHGGQHPNPDKAGEAACEGHDFTSHQCSSVGCCFFEEGFCYALEADRCES